MTQSTKLNQVKREWLLLNAKDQILGRLATLAARLLTGKNKNYYSPNLDCGDYLVVINAKEVKVTGNKENQKKYYSYSGYPGGLKEIKLNKLREAHSEDIVKNAVSGMLPKGKLGKAMIKKLYVYPGPTHQQEAQKPREIEI